MHLGLIGGIGPAATEFYYRGLVKAYASLEATLELTIVHASTRVTLGPSLTFGNAEPLPGRLPTTTNARSPVDYDVMPDGLSERLDQIDAPFGLATTHGVTRLPLIDAHEYVTFNVIHSTPSWIRGVPPENRMEPPLECPGMNRYGH